MIVDELRERIPGCDRRALVPDHGDRWVHEDAPLSPTAYNETLLDAEAAAARFAAPAVPV